MKANTLKIFFYLILLSTVNSCTKDRQFVERSISTSFFIPAGLNTIESHYFKIDNVPLFYKETLQNNNLPVNAKYEVGGAKCDILSRINGFNFALIDRISVFAVDKDDPNRRAEIFYNEEIPIQNISNLRLLASIANFESYIKDNSVNLEVRLIFRGFSVLPITADLDFSYIIYTD